MSIKQQLHALLGKQSSSDRNELVKRMRFHQSWWRAFVLAEDEGSHPMPQKKGESIGSSINKGDLSHSNFLSENAIKAAEETLNDRDRSSDKGLIKEDRLFNNLLSSQPLCFNFFGELKYNLPLATLLLKQFYPDIVEVTSVLFEYAPNAAQNNDNSAHDIAIEFTGPDNKKGLIGLECKYTEPFSPREYDKPEYGEIYEQSKAFTAPYKECIKSHYNQLFRNQLIVESALINKRYDMVYAGLFCYEDDKNALTKGLAFQSMLKDGEKRFQIITFKDFIESLQRLNLSWEQREWTMLLWARYCATQLSDEVKSKINIEEK